MRFNDIIIFCYLIILISSAKNHAYSQTLSISPIIGVTKGFTYYHHKPDAYFKVRANPLIDCGINHGVVIEYIYKNGVSLISGLNTSSSQISIKVNYPYDPPLANAYYNKDYFVTKQDYVTIPILVGINKIIRVIPKKKKTVELFRHKLSAGLTFAFSRFETSPLVVQNTGYYSSVDSVGFQITQNRHADDNISLQLRYETLIKIKTFTCYLSLILNKGLFVQMGGNIFYFAHDKIYYSTYAAYGDFANLSLRYPFNLNRRKTDNPIKSPN
jgi:hypothetical protein